MRLRPGSLPTASCGTSRLQVRDLVQPQHSAADEVIPVASQAAKRGLDLSRCAAIRIGTIVSVHRRIRGVESMAQQQRVRGLVQMDGERLRGEGRGGAEVSTCMQMGRERLRGEGR